jgi:hypothetical protein
VLLRFLSNLQNLCKAISEIQIYGFEGGLAQQVVGLRFANLLKTYEDNKRPVQIEPAFSCLVFNGA